MQPLPFRLKVPGKDALTATEASSTSFRFHGLLHLLEDTLLLEWTGLAQVERVSLLDVEEETVTFPAEELTLPLARVRRLRLRGGWLLPHLELMGNDLDALRIVPSEEAGRVHLWLARRDRRLAAAIAARVEALLGPGG
jgi:hypothetical protein